MGLISRGGWKRTLRFLKDCSYGELEGSEEKVIRDYAEEVVARLKDETPLDSGETANSWSYKISTVNHKVRLDIYNSNISKGCCIAILLQYGHATNGGGYYPGVDYINPAVKPMFDRIQRAAWMEVIK